jgi:P-type conjugative transfer ATPase TrbB
MTKPHKAAILSAILSHKNILIVGGTGSGKTTFANAIIDGIAENCPNDRLIIIEDTAELQCNAANVVTLRSSDNVSMNQLLRATMRLRPDRILVGEVRGPEAMSLLKAWNTGHPGGLATVHANSAAAGLIRLEQLIAESGTTVSMQPLIAEAVDLIVFIEKYNKGRRIKTVATVNGLNNTGDYIINPI